MHLPAFDIERRAEQPLHKLQAFIHAASGDAKKSVF